MKVRQSKHDEIAKNSAKKHKVEYNEGPVLMFRQRIVEKIGTAPIIIERLSRSM